MELSDYARILRKQWILVAICTLVGLIGAIAVSLLSTPKYEASTKVFVSTHSGGSAQELVQGNTFTEKRVTSYADAVSTAAVLQPVIDNLSLGGSVETLAQNITARAPLDTSIIEIVVTNESPAEAMRIADAVAASLTTTVSNLEKPESGGDSPVKVTMIQPAVEPTSPVSPQVPLNIALGVLIGLAVGIGVAILKEVLDTTVRSERDVAEITEVPVIGRIPLDDSATERPLVVQSDPSSVRSEAYRATRTNLQFFESGERPRSFVVTSTIPGEGKSTTTVNLAIALAEAGNKVALVDGDLRRPSIANYMGIEGTVGLTSYLIGQTELEHVLQPWGEQNLFVLPAGQIPPNPSELLGSKQMVELLSFLTSTFDIVLVDAPPLLPVTDAAILSKITGGAIGVVGLGSIKKGQLQASVSSLAAAGGDMIGVVLNRIERKHEDYYAYGYSYSYQPLEDSEHLPPPSSGTSAEDVAPDSNVEKVTSDTGTAEEGQEPVSDVAEEHPADDQQGDEQDHQKQRINPTARPA